MAALGSQRDRFTTATEVQRGRGIAPVTECSGKRKWVQFPWAYSKFLRQSFQEWAGHSIAQSISARAYYRRERGKEHHGAGEGVSLQMDSHDVSPPARSCDL